MRIGALAILDALHGNKVVVLTCLGEKYPSFLESCSNEACILLRAHLLPGAAKNVGHEDSLLSCCNLV